MATTDKEGTIEHRIVKYIEGLGGLCLKLILASLMGWPDRTCLLPGGIIFFVEIKRPQHAKTYYMQTVWQNRLQRLGFVCEFVTSVEDVAAICHRLQGIDT